MGEIGSARADAQMTHARQIQRRHGTQIHHVQLRRELARQHTDRCATVDEVMQHLAGDFLWIGRYTFGHHTMIAGKDRDPQFIGSRTLAPLQAGKLYRQTLQLCQRTRRLGQLLLTGQCRLAHWYINSLCGLEPPGITHSAVPFNVRGKPATVNTTRWQRSASA